MRPDHLKAGPAVQADRSGIGGIADHRNHLPVIARHAVVDQSLQQLAADTLPMHLRRQVDRILDGEAIGWSRPIRPRIGIADHFAIELRRQIRKPAVHQRSKPPRHFGEVGRGQFERRGAMAHLAIVDDGDGGKIGFGSGSDGHGGHGGRVFSPGTKEKPRR